MSAAKQIEDEKWIILHQHKYINQLSPVQKKWFATAITGAITSDGQVDEEEMDYLRTAICFLEDVDDINIMVTMAKKREIPKLGQLKQLPRQVAFQMALTLARVVGVTGKLSSSEKTYLKSTLRKLGFNAFICEHMTKFANNTAILAKMEKDLRKLAYNSEEDYG